MNVFLYFLVILLRLLSAPLIFVWPLISIILSFLLDIVDIEFASRGVLTLKNYEKWDKILDLWWYLNALIFGWINFSEYKFFLLGLFIFRMVGDIIFILKNDRRIFIVFPNLFENVFYLIFFSLNYKQLNYLLDQDHFLISLTLVILLKIFQEWWIHIAQISIPEDFFGNKRDWKK